MTAIGLVAYIAVGVAFVALIVGVGIVVQRRRNRR